jgi:ABC-type Mn2+/Zn2+ transport system permease subunit
MVAPAAQRERDVAVVAAEGVGVALVGQPLSGAIRAGAAVGAIAGVVGIYASYELDLAAGAAVALALCLAAAIGAAIRPWPARAAASARAMPRPQGSSPR